MKKTELISLMKYKFSVKEFYITVKAFCIREKYKYMFRGIEKDT